MKFLKLFLFLCLISKQINSANLNVIRDAETENLFKEIAIELMKDSKFDANKISFYIDNQDFINAFVIPGQKIFLTTRLIIESKKIDDIAGVIGHEIGHIVGGHFTQRVKEMEKSSMIKYYFLNIGCRCISCWGWFSRNSHSYGRTKPWNWKTFSIFKNPRITCRSNCNKIIKKIRFFS